MAPLNVVDLIAIVPYYISIIAAVANDEMPWNSSNDAIRGTTMLRAVRLMRVFRIFKLGRYSAGMQVFYGALAHSATSLFLLFFLLLITVILFSSLMYLVEGEGDKDAAWCDNLPDESNSSDSDDGGIINRNNYCAFKSIPTTFWWAIVTITTVGYGDVIPNTVAGKGIAAVTMITGIIVIALPISVLGNNFTKLMQQYADESVIITQADLDGSGFVDATEVGRWLHAMRRAGKIRDERLTAEDLVRRYDKGGKVGLERKEFLRMCRETVHQGGPSNRELLQKLSTRRPHAARCHGLPPTPYATLSHAHARTPPRACLRSPDKRPDEQYSGASQCAGDARRRQQQQRTALGVGATARCGHRPQQQQQRRRRRSYEQQQQAWPGRRQATRRRRRHEWRQQEPHRGPGARRRRRADPSARKRRRAGRVMLCACPHSVSRTTQQGLAMPSASGPVECTTEYSHHNDLLPVDPMCCMFWGALRAGQQSSHVAMCYRCRR